MHNKEFLTIEEFDSKRPFVLNPIDRTTYAGMLMFADRYLDAQNATLVVKVLLNDKMAEKFKTNGFILRFTEE